MLYNSFSLFCLKNNINFLLYKNIFLIFFVVRFFFSGPRFFCALHLGPRRDLEHA
ncbi:hypothetical protein Hanom_Chr14g01280681 [Helianthus anomalus]